MARITDPSGFENSKMESAGYPEENVKPAKRTRIKKEGKNNLTRGDEGGEKPFKRTQKTLEDGKTYVGGRIWGENRKPVRKELAPKGERKIISRKSDEKPIKRINRASKDDEKILTKISRASVGERKPLKTVKKPFSDEEKGLKLARKPLKRVGKSRVVEEDKPAKKPIYGYGDKNTKKVHANTGRAQNSRKSVRSSDRIVKDSDWSAKPPKSLERPARQSGKPATGTSYRQGKPKDNSQWWPSSKGRRRKKGE